LRREKKMKNNLVMAGTIVAALAIPLAANAQNNATTGAVGGAVVGGPVGAVVGGVGGAIVGGIADDRRSQFHTYVVQEKEPPTGTTAMLSSAPSYLRPASPITMCQQNTA
jgi:hypothetical protein